MKFLIALLFHGAAFAGGIDWSGDLCGKQKQFFTEQFENRVPVDGLVAQIAASGARAVLVGETHFEDDNRYYPFFLEKLVAADAQFDCVTFELNPKDKFPIEFGSDRWQVLVTRARAMKLKVFKIDKCLPALDKFHDFMCLDGRNASMSFKIKTLLGKNICKKILHIGGSMHLQNSRIGGDPNLSERLSAFGIPNYRVQLIDMALELPHPGESRLRDDDPWIWGTQGSTKPACPENPGVVGENFAFINEGVPLAAEVPVFNRPGPQIQSQAWSDFDAALVLGCPQSANDKCESKFPGFLNGN